MTTDTETRPLTPRQRQLVLAVAEHLRRHGTYPTYRDIMGVLGFGSPNAVVGHVDALVRKGWMTVEGGQVRALRLVGVRLVPEYSGEQGAAVRDILEHPDKG